MSISKKMYTQQQQQQQNLMQFYMLLLKLSGKDIANTSPIAIPWTHSPVASKLGTTSLKQSRHGRLISSHGMTQSFPMVCSCLFLTRCKFLYD